MKVKLDDVNEEGFVRLFSVNFNDLGPHSAGKIEQLKQMSKIRRIDGSKISSCDVRWNVENNMIVIKVKIDK